MSKKILVISYIFPPSSKAGAHRAYSMARYLPRFGWEPVFIAPEGGYYGRTKREDHSLLEEIERFAVYRSPLYYPFNDFRSGLVPRVVRRLWDEVMVPDGMILWNRSILRSLDDIVRRHSPRAVFITGMPFSSFLLAPHIKERYGLPIILDYRDPWADNMLLVKTRLKTAISRRLEKKAVASATLVTTASYHMIDYIRSSHPRDFKETEFLGFPYGYDREFFEREILPAPSEDRSKMTITFGGFPDGDIRPEVILRGLERVANDDRWMGRLRIVCYGTLFGDIRDQDALLSRFNLADKVEIRPFAPYREFLLALRNSSVLLLPHGTTPINQVTFPSKFFDYLGVKRPMLYIGKGGQVPETIRECQAGLSTHAVPQQIEAAVRELCENADSPEWYSGTEAYERLDRTNIFAEFVNKLESIV